jgi:hypothetical protein
MYKILKSHQKIVGFLLENIPLQIKEDNVFSMKRLQFFGTSFFFTGTSVHPISVPVHHNHSLKLVAGKRNGAVQLRRHQSTVHKAQPQTAQRHHHSR